MDAVERPYARSAMLVLGRLGFCLATLTYFS